MDFSVGSASSVYLACDVICLITDTVKRIRKPKATAPLQLNALGLDGWILSVYIYTLLHSLSSILSLFSLSHTPHPYLSFSSLPPLPHSCFTHPSVHRRCGLVRLRSVVARQQDMAQQTTAVSLCLWHHVRCQVGVQSSSSTSHSRAARQTPLPGLSVCLSVCLSLRLSLSVCLSVSVSVSISVCMCVMH